MWNNHFPFAKKKKKRKRKTNCFHSLKSIHQISLHYSITFLSNIKHDKKKKRKKIRPCSGIQMLMFHFFILEKFPMNGESLQITTRHNVMEQLNWSIKTMSRLFVIQSCCEVYRTNFKPKAPIHPPSFPHPNNKYQTSLEVCQSFTICFKMVIRGSNG